MENGIKEYIIAVSTLSLSKIIKDRPFTVGTTRVDNAVKVRTRLNLIRRHFFIKIPLL